MSTTSSEGPFGAAGYGAGTSRSSGSTSAGSAQGSGAGTSADSGSGSGSGDSGSGSSNNGYYGSGGAAYSSGSGSSTSGSTGSTSGATNADAATALSRGAVTTRTAPTQRVTGATTPGASKAGAAGAAGARKHKGPRRVRLAVARVDPWSVMKMSFLLSVAIGIAGVILTAVLWMILSTMNVFSDIEGVLQSLQTTTADPFSIKDYVGFGRVVSLSIVIGVIDVILMTAIATVMAFLYNICSALVGGVQLTLTDD